MEFLDQTLVRLLKPLLDPLHGWLDSLPPVMWRASACALIAAGILWVLVLKRESIFRGAPKSGRLYDLRIWTCALLLPYIAIYIFF